MISRYLAAILDNSDDAIIGKHLNSIITSWNQGAEGDLRLHRNLDPEADSTGSYDEEEQILTKLVFAAAHALTTS